MNKETVLRVIEEVSDLILTDKEDYMCQALRRVARFNEHVEGYQEACDWLRKQIGKMLRGYDTVLIMLIFNERGDEDPKEFRLQWLEELHSKVANDEVTI